jgi:hypothetical protein
MASTTLPNGITVPEKFSRDWYADLYHNWQELDNLLGGGTPKDGTLTIQKNGDTVGTFSANQATDETVNIEVPDVNNGTLTIQKNGNTVGTFSANQATDETINISVPDVNNGALTIQQNGTTVDTFTANSSGDKTVNIQCVDLTNNQTVAGNKEFTGTTTAHDVIPSATDTYNFGTSTNKWKSFNEINPGALSLPSLSKSHFIDLDTTNYVWDGITANSYTSEQDGYLLLFVKNTNIIDNGCLYAITSNNAIIGYVPIVKDAPSALDTYNLVGAQIYAPASARVIMKLNASSIFKLRFVLCQGNV